MAEMSRLVALVTVKQPGAGAEHSIRVVGRARRELGGRADLDGRRPAEVGAGDRDVVAAAGGAVGRGDSR